MNKYKILYVDDDQRLCRLVKRYVENYDFDFVMAHNANEAHRTLTENSDVSLILLDIMLPDRDGLTLLRKFEINHQYLLFF
jgi:DNA-binding response OmpR family regulator